MQPTKTPAKGRVLTTMAKDSNGKKFNRIEQYDRVQNDKVIHVREHIRSNSKTCNGKK